MKTFVNIEAVHAEEIDLRDGNEMELKIKMDGNAVVQVGVIAEAFKQLSTLAIEKRDPELTMVVQSKLLELTEHLDSEMEKAKEEMIAESPLIAILAELFERGE